MKKIDYRKLNAVIESVEEALDRKLKVEKGMVNICLRYTGANLRNIVKCLLEGEYPVVKGVELHHDLAKPLGVALEAYGDESARNEDVKDLIKKWNMNRRKNALNALK